MQRKDLLAATYKNLPLNSKASSENILNTWASVINSILLQINENDLQGISIAVPGPFDYNKGICLIKGLDKYDGFYGIQAVDSIINRLCVREKQLLVAFHNDAHCFAVGEAVFGAAKNYSKIIALTLGTGFGAAFYSCNCIITEGKNVPENGELYNIPFKEGAAEDYISTRWFLQTYWEQTGEKLPGVKELYERAEKDIIAQNIFSEFGKNLGQILVPFILSFEAECIVLGGNISKAGRYFLPTLQKQFAEHSCGPKILFSSLGEKAALMGSAQLLTEKMLPVTDPQSKTLRKTNQFLIPLEQPGTPKDRYDIYPAFPLSGDYMEAGYTALAEAIKDKQTVIIEGYAGVFWDEIVTSLNAVFIRQDRKVTWYCADAAFKSEKEIDEMLKPYLGGDDPIFGTIYPGILIQRPGIIPF